MNLNRILQTLPFLLFLASIPLQSQHFEWASSGSSIFSGYSKSCITSTGRLAAAGEYNQPTSYIPGSGIPTLHSGTGQDFLFENYSSQVYATCFGQTGEMLWVFQSNKIMRDASLMGVASDPNGNVILAFQSRSYISFDFEMLEGKEWKQVYSSEFNNNRAGDKLLTFFATLNGDGQVLRIVASRDFPRESWNEFLATPDGGYAITFSDELKSVNEKGVHVQHGYHFVIKLDKDFSKQWEHKSKLLAPSCCSYYIPSCLIAVGKDGDLYAAGNYNFGIAVEGSKDRMIEPFYETGQYKPPYEAYIARIGKDGKLKWVKYMNGKSLIKSIHATDSQVLIGGTIQLQRDFMGLAIDTTESKNGFLAALDLKGKAKWVQNFNASSVEAICSDVSGGIYASFESKRSGAIKPLKIGLDTIPNTYDGVVVAAFEPEGSYKWYKSSRAMLSRNTRPNLLSDACGNLYFTGEMWFVLSASMNIFDAALVKGRGYGGAPLAAKIRTTIPDELIAFNQNLPSKSAEANTVEKPATKPEKPGKNEGRNANRAENTARGSAPDSSALSRGPSVCMPIPYPWKLLVFPNPSAGPVTIRIETSYADPKVSVELWDSKGALIKVIRSAQLQSSGSLDLQEDLSSLAKGLYFVVLKGSSAAASERLVIAK